MAAAKTTWRRRRAVSLNGSSAANADLYPALERTRLDGARSNGAPALQGRYAPTLVVTSADARLYNRPCRGGPRGRALSCGVAHHRRTREGAASSPAGAWCARGAGWAVRDAAGVCHNRTQYPQQSMPPHGRDGTRGALLPGAAEACGAGHIVDNDAGAASRRDTTGIATIRLIATNASDANPRR